MILHLNDLFPSSIKSNFQSCYIHVYREELALKSVGDRSNATHMCTANTQIPVSKHHSPIKVSRLLEGVIDSRPRARKMQQKTGTSGGATK